MSILSADQLLDSAAHAVLQRTLQYLGVVADVVGGVGTHDNLVLKLRPSRTNIAESTSTCA